MTRAEAAELVAVLSSAYRAQSITEATCQVYETMLADLGYAAAQRAIARLIATSRYMPTVAEIREAVLEVERGPQRGGVEAWGDVLEAIRRVGAYNPAPEFGDPIVSECVRLMGWVALCRGTNEAADRARFVELYESLAQRRRKEQVVGDSLQLAAAGAAGRLAEGLARRMALPGGNHGR